jgi:hypothetical protein
MARGGGTTARYRAKNEDHVDATVHGEEGKRFGRQRNLTTKTQEWSARSEGARGGRNRGRRPVGVDAVKRR